jgi:diguanylate cyclase (GGDEF)-like protein
LCAVTLLVAAAAMPRSATALDLTDGAGYRFVLDAEAQVLVDAEAALDLAGARSAWQAGRFQPLPQGRPNFGFTRSAIWVHLRLRNLNHPARRWVLLVEQPRLDEITVYVDGATGPARDVGDSLPFDARSLPLRWPNVELELPPDRTLDVFVRVRSTSSVQVPLHLVTPTEAWRMGYAAQLAQGGLLGVLLALLLYSFGVWISIREPTYLYYIALVSAIGLLSLSMSGLGFQYLWPHWPGWQNAALPVAIAVTLTAATGFTRRFLELDRNLPRWVPLFRGAPLLLLLLAVGGCTPLRFESTVLLNVLVLLLVLLMTAAAVACAMRRWRPAYVFLAAWAALIVGGLATSASAFGALPRTPMVESGLQAGAALGMLLLAFSLAYRLQLLRTEAERVSREAAETLERRVSERTAELEGAARKLEELNGLLRDMSLRDGLTGLYNRRCLDQVLLEAWKTTTQRREPLSLLMIDIDHFKQLNDRHGHGAGDDCLREIAQRLSRHSTTLGGVVARYGGEEFLVVLAHTDADMATALAEALRTAVAGAPVRCGAQTLSITVSIGVSTSLRGARDSLGAVVKRADEALYKAKRTGRNRVVVA